MPDHYTDLAVRGDRWPVNRRMHVMLYPNTPEEADACAPGSTVPAAIERAAAQLFDADAVSHYRIARFPAERDDLRYPRVASEDLRVGFEDFLRGTTDAFSDKQWCTDEECRDLKRYRGVHLLVHGYGFSTHLANAEAADNCENHGGTGFSRGVMAWTSTDDGSGAGLTHNSAIQETVHQFIRANADPVQRLFCDMDGDGERSHYEEHTLGAITEDRATTPMLTYHVDEHAGCPGPVQDWDGSYSPVLTDRTVAAVAATGRNQCRPQPGRTNRPDDI